MSDRIELHPATDRWMMGDRYGSVVGEFVRRGRRFFRVRMDRSGKTVTVSESNVGRWL
jgi:hypothetical protein